MEQSNKVALSKLLTEITSKGETDIVKKEIKSLVKQAINNQTRKQNYACYDELSSYNWDIIFKVLHSIGSINIDIFVIKSLIKCAPKNQPCIWINKTDSNTILQTFQQYQLNVKYGKQLFSKSGITFVTTQEVSPDSTYLFIQTQEPYAIALTLGKNIKQKPEQWKVSNKNILFLKKSFYINDLYDNVNTDVFDKWIDSYINKIVSYNDTLEFTEPDYAHCGEEFIN